MYLPCVVLVGNGARLGCGMEREVEGILHPPLGALGPLHPHERRRDSGWAHLLPRHLGGENGITLTAPATPRIPVRREHRAKLRMHFPHRREDVGVEDTLHVG